MMQRLLPIFALLVLLTAPAAATDISADTYYDKLRGMWLGQLVGNYAGKPTEGYFYGPNGSPANSLDWSSFISTNPWVADDDTDHEYMYASLLGATPDPTNAQIAAAWQSHIDPNYFFFANRQSSYLIGHGLTPPQTGAISTNVYWWSIDSQITTESIGALAPGMRQRAADLSGRFGSVTNDGFAVHAAQFYAGLMSAAAVDSDIPDIIQKALATVPVTSRTHQAVQDVVNWYNANPGDWRWARQQIYNYYGDGSLNRGRYFITVESTVNVACTTLALLYGGGDFKRTTELSVLCGYDCDCNGATAAGIMGMIKGYSNLPADIQAAADAYRIPELQNMPTNSTTVSQWARSLQAAGEQQILLQGGSITGTGAGRTYHLPADTIAAPIEKPDPAGPRGLVGQLQSAGRTVTMLTSSSTSDPTKDRYDVRTIIDGITDVSYNGHLPYITDGTAAGGIDYYQLDFGRKVTLNSVVYYEGDLAAANWGSDPWAGGNKGGFFTSLSVQVRQNGVFVPVSNLSLSEPLDELTQYQRIVLNFDGIAGDAVRIVGPAGGTAHYTSCVELDAYGLPGLPGDANLDDRVSFADYLSLANNFGQSGNWGQGDFNGDGKISFADYIILANNFGQSVPEPATLFLLLTGAGLLRRLRYGVRRP